MKTATLTFAAAYLVFVACTAGAAEREAKPPAAASVAELEAQIRAILDETKTPAIGVALVDREKTIWAAGLGIADVASGRMATADTLFRIGSVSKSFASLSVLALVEEGKLSLEDTIRSRAPEIAFQNPWEATDPVRLVHVLEHTAGFDDIHLKEYALSRPGISIADALAYHPRSRTSRWRPGTRMSYCNSGPPIAARVVELVTGKPFDEFVQERFFNPLGMTTASYFLTPDVEARMATLYHPDGRTPFPYWHVAVWPSGSINASAAEMARYVRFFLGRGRFDERQILSSASVDRMERAESTLAAKAGVSLGYGLSNYAMPDGGFVWHGHNGGVEGGIASLAYLPDEGVGYVFMINSGSAKAYEEIEDRIRAFLTRGRTPPPVPPVAVVLPEVAARWSGYFVPASPRNELFRWAEELFGTMRVRLDGGALRLHPLIGKTASFVAVTGTTFRHIDDADSGEDRVASLALLEDEGETLMQSGGSTWRRTLGWKVWSLRLFFGFCLLGLATVPLFLLTALILRWKRRWSGGRAGLAIALPVLAVACLVVAVGSLALSNDDLLTRFGNPTAWSVTLFIASLGFALCGLGGLVAAWQTRDGALRPWLRGWACLVSASASGLAVYLAYWGWIGVRTWV